MVAGVNGALLEVRYGSPGDEPLRAGDRLVTSGDGGIFPPGVPVAVVTDAAGAPPRARPIARPDGLGYVIVERPYLPPVATTPQAPRP
jgi:rod shape-determining protein MreC